MVTNTNCDGCGRTNTNKVSYTKKRYCNKCFLKLVEKRVRKDLRINKKITKKTIELLNDDSKEFRVAKQLLKNIFGSHKTIKEVKKLTKETLTPTNLDREIKLQLESYLNNKKYQKKTLCILDNVLEEEIITFCRIKKLAIGKKEEKNKLIENIEKKYHGTKFALSKSFEKITENLPKKDQKNI